NDAIILGIQNPAENVVTYYETLADALNGTNPIVTSSSYVSAGNQTIFARIEEVATGDFDTTNFELYVNPTPPDLGPFEMVLCDDELQGSTPTDEISTFDFTSLHNEITNGDPSLTIAWFLSYVDEAADIPIPN